MRANYLEQQIFRNDILSFMEAQIYHQHILLIISFSPKINSEITLKKSSYLIKLD